ncbi:MAG: hypothetical protein Q4C10_15950, partial [Clostridia bacterium]|nr:hypothetical protein [Clostridia bacterium]
MKKLVFLLCLCLCLNGAAVAEESAPTVEGGAAAVETVEEQPKASNDAQQDEKPQEAPASDAPQSNDAGQSKSESQQAS